MTGSSWLEARKTGIGGSEIGTVLDLNPYETKRELWQRKLGRIGDKPVTPAMQRGKELETLVAQQYADKANANLFRIPRGSELNANAEVLTMHPLCLRSKSLPWMVGSPDFFIRKKNSVGVLEIKCPGFRMYGKIKRDGLPLYMVAQLQHYLKMLELSWGAFAIFSAEFWELIHFEMESDPDLQNRITEEGSKFWELIVNQQEPPEPVLEAIPEPVGISGPKPTVVRMDTPEFSQAARDLALAMEIKEEADELVERAKASILNLMGTAEAVEGSGLRVYNTLNKGRITVDRGALAAKYPEIYNEVMRVGASYRTFRTYFLKKEGAYYE